MLQFLIKYCNMVTRLLTFIEATRSRNWLLHLDSVDDMIADFASMDRIKYRRLAAVYVADMRYLEISDQETWNYCLDGDFCCQKDSIPYTAIGRDHCGEQENKVQFYSSITVLSIVMNSARNFSQATHLLEQCINS